MASYRGLEGILTGLLSQLIIQEWQTCFNFFGFWAPSVLPLSPKSVYTSFLEVAEQPSGASPHRARYSSRVLATGL